MSSKDTAQRGRANLASMIPGRLLAQALLIATVLILARLMGAETYGRYAAVMAVMAIVQTLSAGGLPMVEVRFLAPLWQREDRSAALALGSAIWSARLFLSALAGFLAWLWLWRSPQLGLSWPLALSLAGYAFLRCFYESTRSLLLPLGRAATLMRFEVLRALLTLPVVALPFLLFGLDAAFHALALLYLGMLILAWRSLRHTANLSPSSPDRELLKPHLSFAAAAWTGEVASMVQAQLAVYAVARWGEERQAGILALALQAFLFVQGLVLTARRALLPPLSELQEAGEEEQLRAWGERMLRYSVAVLALGLGVWTWVGPWLVTALLGREYQPVCGAVAAMLLAGAAYGAATVSNGLLYVRGQARLAAVHEVLFAAITVVGLIWLLRGGWGSAPWVALVYAAAASVFFALAWLGLLLKGGLRLGLLRPALLLLPALVIALGLSWREPGWHSLGWPALAPSSPAHVESATSGEAALEPGTTAWWWPSQAPEHLGVETLGPALIGALAYSVLYAIWALGLRLLPWSELQVLSRRRPDRSATD